jgi:lipoate-protein ligase A
MSVLDRLDVYHDSEPRSAALNMGVDEAIFQTATTPAIRFYSWLSPALSFGYFGSLDEAAKQGGKRELVRRWTGGGIVLHGTDLTYSFVVPASHRYSTESARKIYSDIHGAICDVLLEQGVRATLANSAPPKASEACFANPVISDVLLGGKKIAGAAQRRTRTGLLQQGSIQLQLLSAEFAERLACILCPSAQAKSPGSEMTQLGHEIAERKYATRAWLNLR